MPNRDTNLKSASPNSTYTSPVAVAPNRKKRKAKEGPKLPPFIWFISFPQAQLYYFHSEEQALDFLPSFMQNIFLTDPVIGFDLEWKPNFVKGSIYLSDYKWLIIDLLFYYVLFN
jgi:hypothetical protein